MRPPSFGIRLRRLLLDYVIPRHLRTVLRHARRETERMLRPLQRKSKRPKPRDLEEQIYEALIRPGDLILDVGAHDGRVSIFLARLAGPSGKVFAFEPVRPIYQRLCDNVSADIYDKAPIIPVCAGAAETARTATIHIPDGKYGEASIATAESWQRVKQSSGLQTFECALVSLDAFLAENKLGTPDFVKIDVEGAEKFVLQGAAQMLGSRIPPLMLIELVAAWEQGFDYGPWEVLALLEQRGYRFLFQCPDGLIDHEATEAHPFPPEFEDGYNVIAFVPGVHRERIARASPLRRRSGARLLPMYPLGHKNVVARPAAPRGS